MTEHIVKRYMSETAYCARCSCGWHTSRRSYELRERSAHAHELEGTLTVRRVEADQ